MFNLPVSFFHPVHSCKLIDYIWIFRRDGIVRQKGWSQKTSNTSLRTHLNATHKIEYLREVDKGSWINGLKYAVDQRKAEALAKAASLGLNQLVIPFSPSALVHHLVRFIAANDQVSCNRLILWIPTLIPKLTVDIEHKRRGKPRVPRSFAIHASRNEQRRPPSQNHSPYRHH